MYVLIRVFFYIIISTNRKKDIISKLIQFFYFPILQPLKSSLSKWENSRETFEIINFYIKNLMNLRH